MQIPCIDHWKVVVRIQRYLKMSRGRVLLYDDTWNIEISRYCDVDWAGS